MKEAVHVTEPNSPSCTFCHSERLHVSHLEKKQNQRSQRSWENNLLLSRLPEAKSCVSDNLVWYQTLLSKVSRCLLGALKPTAFMLHPVPSNGRMGLMGARLALAP